MSFPPVAGCNSPSCLLGGPPQLHQAPGTPVGGDDSSSDSGEDEPILLSQTERRQARIDLSHDMCITLELVKALVTGEGYDLIIDRPRAYQLALMASVVAVAAGMNKQMTRLTTLEDWTE